VKSAPTTLSTIVLLVAVIGITGVPVFAAEVHPVCATKQHDCGRTAKITCCCEDQGNTSNQGGPVESRVQLNASLIPAAGVSAITGSADLCPMIVRAHISPPRAGPVDLPTLFASLLI
jgi:hypothetical protein